MSFDNIPEELKALRQWLVWRLEDIGAKRPTKVPYNAITGKLASVSEPSDWCDFNTAVARSSNYSGIGFVFSNNDSYSFIDLDDSSQGNNYQADFNRQLKIFKEFDSYSEVSPSGKGLHIIVKGNVPSGRRRSFIEIYSSLRYATFTGNVYHNKPIVDCQDKLTQLWEQMGTGVATTVYNGDAEEKSTDAEIVSAAGNAVNGDKFKILLEGKWQDIYPSQSEADFAFIDIVSFYTQNRKQIARIFKASPLGQRDKAKRSSYIESMILRSFDRMLPQIDFDGFKNALEAKVAEVQSELPLGVKRDVEQIRKPTIAIPKSENNLSLPPGLLGELAQFIYQAAPRPVPEIALAGAIGLMAGIVGRAYNVSGTGLNQYILVLAKTGRGKESAATGIDKLMNAIKMQVPTSKRFRGPGIINSGQALVKYLSNVSNCFVSVLGEFGITIERISNHNANPSDKMLYQMLLDLYNKSGYGQTYQPSIYSKKEDNIDITDSPALTILGESTHKLFYDALNEEMISAGLLPRFLIIEYNGIRVDLNENHTTVQPSMILVDRFASLVASCEQIMHSKKVINVAINKEAAEVLRGFDRTSTFKINSEPNDVIAELWNRAHMKAMRLAALVAVGINMWQPVITEQYADWAISLVQNDIKALSSKFEQGLIGTNSYEAKQIAEIIKAMKDYIVRDFAGVEKYLQGKTSHLMHTDKIVTYSYISKRLISLACYRLDKSGSTYAIKRALQVLLDSDRIREIGKTELSQKYGTTQRSFIVNDLGMLD